MIIQSIEYIHEIIIEFLVFKMPYNKFYYRMGKSSVK
jgi:hypothetical protein